MAFVNVHKLLHENFGFSEFRPLQQEIITAIIKGQDTLAVLPTGGGKSLCYQLPALIFEGLTIVVSPLISLMQDQVQQLARRGIPAAVLNSSLSREEYTGVINDLKARRLKLLYLAPETLVKERTRNLLTALPVSCIAIDEAHCISEWGHDFRSEYRELAGVRQQFPDAVTLALTATATPRVRKDIVRNLRLPEPAIFVAGFDRPNFFLEVIKKQGPDLQALEFIQEHAGESGIVYCISRKNVDKLSAFLKSHGVRVLPYHAGLSDKDRREYQKAFTAGSVDVIVATIAFGMGIDKPDIRFVLHYELPQDLESYYQQIGRAGRDGQAAYCRLLFSYGDVHKIRFFIDKKAEQEQAGAEERLQAMLNYAQAVGCRRIPLLAYFGEKAKQTNCTSCDGCVLPEGVGTDMGADARLILYCMVQTKELFGGKHLIDVLHGRESEKTRRHNHQNLSLWAGGKHLDRGEWMDLLRYLEERRLVFRDPKYHGFKLSADGEAFLKSKEPLVLRMPSGNNNRGKGGAATFGDGGKSAGKTKKSAPASGPVDETLREALRQFRLKLAREEEVPAFRIFSNKTLDALASHKPGDEQSLLAVPGIGPQKAEAFGEKILEIVREREG